MEVIEMRVTLTPSEAAEVVGDKLAGGIVSAELLDSYNRRAADGKEVVVRLFERYVRQPYGIICVLLTARR